MTNNNYKVFTYNCQLVIYKGCCIFDVGESLAKKLPKKLQNLNQTSLETS